MGDGYNIGLLECKGLAIEFAVLSVQNYYLLYSFEI